MMDNNFWTAKKHKEKTLTAKLFVHRESRSFHSFHYVQLPICITSQKNNMNNEKNSGHLCLVKKKSGNALCVPSTLIVFIVRIKKPCFAAQYEKR